MEAVFSLRKDLQSSDIITEINLKTCGLHPKGGLQVATRAGPFMVIAQATEASPSMVAAPYVTSASFEAKADPIGGCRHSLFCCFFPFYLILSFIPIY